MPNKIRKKDFRPRDKEVLEIPINSRTGKKADLVGIHRGKQVIGFFTTIGRESVTPGIKTNTGWKYYPVSEKAYYVLFDVTPDEHPKARTSDKIISITEFLDENKQKIAISRVKPQ